MSSSGSSLFEGTWLRKFCQRPPDVQTEKITGEAVKKGAEWRLRSGIALGFEGGQAGRAGQVVRCPVPAGAAAFHMGGPFANGARHF